MREATEGFYPDRNMSRGWGEVMPDPDMALSIRKITRRGCDCIARRAFDLARTRRRRVTAIHKANSFQMTDGLFLECTRVVAAEYPDVQLDDLLVDAATAHLVREPERFDVLLATNFDGDILSDLASDELCCAQAQHGSAPSLAGKDIANPVAMILSVAMLLAWLGKRHGHDDLAQAARAIDGGVDAVLENPETRTADLQGSLGCRAFASRVAGHVALGR